MGIFFFISLWFLCFQPFWIAPIYLQSIVLLLCYLQSIYMYMSLYATETKLYAIETKITLQKIRWMGGIQYEEWGIGTKSSQIWSEIGLEQKY